MMRRLEDPAEYDARVKAETETKRYRKFFIRMCTFWAVVIMLAYLHGPVQ